MFRFLVFMMLLIGTLNAEENVSVTKVDFLEDLGIEVNAAGPLLLRMDEARNRLIVANTLSSSLTIIDCEANSPMNIPLGGRTLQHLKSEAMTFSRKTGDIYLIGLKCFHIVSPERGKVKAVRTEVQFESIAVDEGTGNVFVAGRESGSLGFYRASSRKLKMLKWLDRSEDLINLNATPPPPIRKVIADNELKRIVAVDGFSSTLYLFDSSRGRLLESRPLNLTGGGRWHLAGYDEKDHRLFIVTETSERKVIEAARIDVAGGSDVVIPLPQFTEAVGIVYNPAREEIYIPYDNHPSVHVVGFDGDGDIDEIKIPAYGNDASAVDQQKDLLYIASWAFGEINVIDLRTRRLRNRITGLGILPHMFSMAFDPGSSLIYFPKGATAVNGTFGSALSSLDTETGEISKIHTGWAPIDLIGLEGRNSFLVFNSEDQFAEVRPDGSYELYDLPFDYPIEAVHGPGDSVYLSYGPHQSYWPTVYIWGAKNGILAIDSNDLSFYDRRIPRQALQMVLDGEGVLYFTQNNWGKEEQFLGVLEDEIRVYNPAGRITLADTVERETTQRILRCDRDANRLYLVRLGERDDEPSILQVIDPVEKKVVRKIVLGLTATDLVFDDRHIYVTNFDSDSVSVVDKESFAKIEAAAGEKPFRLCRCGSRIFLINWSGNTIREVGGEERVYDLPTNGQPDNLFSWGGKLIITSRDRGALFISRFDPATGSFELLHREEYPYGDIRFDSRNTSFYTRGQFGDALFEITKAAADGEGRFWLTDFLSGKLFILEAY